MTAEDPKPSPDASLLTPNDLRRLRVKMDGRDPRDTLASGVVEDVFQTMILAYRLREDPEFTWEQAGDVAPGDVFDMTGDEPPLTETPAPDGSPPAPSGVSGSRRKRSGTASAPSSAPTTT